MSLHETLGLSNGFLDGEAVQAETLAIVLHALVLADGRIHHDTFLRIVALVTDVSTFHQGDNGQIEVLGKSIVATVVGGYGHDGSRAVTGQYVLGNVDGTMVARDGVDAVCTAEHARHRVVNHALTLGTAFYVFDVFVYGLTLFGSGNHIHQLALGSQYKEGHAKHRIGTGGEDGKVHILVCHFYLNLGTFASTNPVLLGFLDALAPLDGFQTVQQTLAIGTDTQAPLAHLLLFHRVAATLTHTVHHLVVGQHGAQSWTPVHHRFAHEGQTVVHQHVALFFGVPAPPLLCGKTQFFRTGNVPIACSFFLKVLYEHFNGHGLLCLVTEETIKHFLESPLRPLVVIGRASTHLAVPVEAEPYLVQLFSITIDVGKGGFLGVLTGLDGILLCRQTVCVIPHRIQHVETLQTLVACIDVAGDVAKRMTYVQTSTAWVGEHIQYVELLSVLVLSHVVGLLFHPPLVPLLLNLSEIVFFCHREYLYYYICAAKLQNYYQLSVINCQLSLFKVFAGHLENGFSPAD